VSFHSSWKIAHRIACEEFGYPISEARYATIDEYIMALVRDLKPGQLRYVKTALERLYTEAFNNGYDEAMKRKE
jgi:hypothetical protein